MTPTDYFGELIAIIPFIFNRVIFVTALVAGWQFSNSPQLDNYFVCLTLAALLFFVSNGFLVATMGFSPLQIMAASLVISKTLREIFS